jgi:flagellin-specific chaperone FliS
MDKAEIYYPEAELTFSLGYKELYKRLIEVHNTARVLDEESRIEEKIQAYGHVMDIVGQLQSIALEEKESAYAARKEKESDIYFGLREGLIEINGSKKKHTVKDAEYLVQKLILPYRTKEREWIRNAKRWENARGYILEQINILKKVQTRQQIELNQLNQSRGRA